MKMRKYLRAILTVGISGSGKTSFAEDYCNKNRHWVNVNRDDIRVAHFGSGYKFNRKHEEFVSEVQRTTISNWHTLGFNLVISDTNLNPTHRNDLVKYLEELGYSVEFKTFPIDLQEAIRRDVKRAKSVGYEVIHRQWKQWLEFSGREQYVPDEFKPDAVIVDVDGTLADMKGIRGPFEWDKVHLDRRRDIVADMVDGLARLDYAIIILSGRDGCCEEATRRWLDDNLYWYDHLFIREAGDMRKDAVVKEEIFWEHIAQNFNVKTVIDDRPQVCRMWRDLGLDVIQVADPYKEF